MDTKNNILDNESTQLPAGWVVKRLGDIIAFNPTEKLSKGSIAKKIAMEQLQPYTRKIVGYEMANFSGGSKFRNEDTLLARITPCLENGKTAYVDILNDDEISFGSTEFIVLREKENLTDSKFIYYLSVSPDFRDKAIKSMSGSSGRQRVQIDELINHEIAIPPIKEQKEIAAILSSLDDKIELNQQINKKLEEIAQAIFKEWFIDFNFPDENDKPYRNSGGAMVDSELGLIPASWSVGNLGGICEVISKGTTPTLLQIENLDKSIPFIKVKDIASNGTINISGLDLIPDEVHKKVLKRSILKTGDILFSIAGTIGRVSILPENLNNSNCNQAVAFIRLKGREYLEFIHQHLISQNIQGLILGSIVQGVQANVSLTTLGSIPVLFPDEYSLMRFNCLIKPIYKKITDNDTQISSVICIRNTLLPKLMSGNLRMEKV